MLRRADIGITQVYAQMAQEELRKSCPMAFSSESAYTVSNTVSSSLRRSAYSDLRIAEGFGFAAGRSSAHLGPNDSGGKG